MVEERKWLESAVEVVQVIQEPEDITITDVVFHSRQENAVEPHEHLNIKAAKDVLNSSQKTTVNVSDMPLYMLFRSRSSVYHARSVRLTTILTTYFQKHVRFTDRWHL